MEIETRTENKNKEHLISMSLRKILDDRGKDGEKEYLVKWKYYDETSWQPASDFLADDAIREYNAKWRKSTRLLKKK